MAEAAAIGAGVSIFGSLLGAQGSRQAADNVVAAAEYNAALVDEDLVRTLDSMSTEINRLSGSQAASAGASGAAVASSSVLSIMNQTLNGFNRQVQDSIDTAEAQKQAILFEGQSQAQAIQNQAISNLITSIGSASLLFAL